MRTKAIDRVTMRYEAPPQALDRWQPEIKAVDAADDEFTINIYSTVGEYGDGAGMTPKLVSALLRKADGADIKVNINSPGGDFFDGLAIHTLLKDYAGKVRVRVVGMAASAASVVAMAGDEIEIAKGAFLMIHNAWTIAIGNRHDMGEVADTLSKFDASMKKLYSARTGVDEKKVEKMMDAETWIDADEAVETGFADSIMGDDEVEVDETKASVHNAALKKVDVVLAKAGMPRSERRDLIKELTATPSAGNADDPTPRAEDAKLVEQLSALLATIKSGVTQ